MSAACRAVLRSKTAVTSTEFLLFPTKSCIRKLSRGSRLVQRCAGYAAVAHLVERHLAKVEVASSSLVGRSNMKPSFVQRCTTMAFFNRNCIKC